MLLAAEWLIRSIVQVSVYRDSNSYSTTLTGNGKRYPIAPYHGHRVLAVLPHGVPRVATLKYGTSSSPAFICHLDPLFAFATRRSTMIIAVVATHLFSCFVLVAFLCIIRVEAQDDARCLSGWDWVRNWNGGNRVSRLAAEQCPSG